MQADKPKCSKFTNLKYITMTPTFQRNQERIMQYTNEVREDDELDCLFHTIDEGENLYDEEWDEITRDIIKNVLSHESVKDEQIVFRVDEDVMYIKIKHLNLILPQDVKKLSKELSAEYLYTKHDNFDGMCLNLFHKQNPS